LTPGKISSVTELPTWAIWLAVFLLPLIGFAVGVISSWLGRKGAIETHDRANREELMRQFRWASEMACSDHPITAQLGINNLRAILKSPLLDDDDRLFVDASLAAVIHKPQAEIEAALEAGDDIQVVQLDIETTAAADLPLVDDDDGGQE
jgi:hypothetical protein